MPIRVLLMLLALAYGFPDLARAEILRCSAAGEDYRGQVKIDVDIVLPEARECNKSLWARGNQSGSDVKMLGPASIAMGIIETRAKTPPSSESERHELIVTVAPGSANSLTGIYIPTDGRPVLIKADLWDKSRRFTMASSFEGVGLAVFTGTCN